MYPIFMSEQGLVKIHLKNLVVVLLYLSDENVKRHQYNNENKKAFVRTKEFVWRQNKFGARIKIMWEEQLVDPPIHYIPGSGLGTRTKREFLLHFS